MGAGRADALLRIADKRILPLFFSLGLGRGNGVGSRVLRMALLPFVEDVLAFLGVDFDFPQIEFHFGRHFVESLLQVEHFRALFIVFRVVPLSFFLFQLA